MSRYMPTIGNWEQHYGRLWTKLVAIGVGVAPLLLVAACGRLPESGATVGTSPTASPQDSPSAISSPSSSPTPIVPSGWQTYSDATFAFRIAYPAAFTFKREGNADPVAMWLAEYRAVDNRYLNGYPPGQVELGVYSMNADTLDAWLTLHTGVDQSTHSQFYWAATSNVQAATIVGRAVITFDVQNGPALVHVTIFRHGVYLIRLDWYSTDSTYSSDIQAVADQMLKSFGD